MKKVLIINGHQYYENIAEGKLTQNIIDRATSFFENKGLEVSVAVVDKEYNLEDERKKLQEADFVFFQHPVYWMGMPWKAKKYLDEVLTPGVHYGSDGRSREDASKRYGSGGLLNGKYMISLTYNCPTSEFDDKEGFFDGLSLDEANIADHKIFQFCGLEKTETFSVHDIFKGDMTLEDELKRLDTILENNLK